MILLKNQNLLEIVILSPAQTPGRCKQPLQGSDELPKSKGVQVSLLLGGIPSIHGF